MCNGNAKRRRGVGDNTPNCGQKRPLEKCANLYMSNIGGMLPPVCSTRTGTGMLPVRLSRIEGDEKEDAWTLINPDQVNHPVFRFFDGDTRQLLDGVKVFRWWQSQLPRVAYR